MVYTADESLAPSAGQGIGRYVPRRISVRVDPLLRIQGYDDPSSVRSVIRNTAESVVDVAQRAFRPEVFHRRMRIASCIDDGLMLETGTTFRSGAFSAFLNECDQVVVFIVTVGADVDSVLRNFSEKGQVLEALLMETAGWLGVEATTKSFTQHLRAQAKKEGHRITRRLGPGYSYQVGTNTFEWPLNQQTSLFALFDSVPLSVRLLDSCAMIPKMSRSGLYGLRPQ
ncbi:MAG: hypothetical protein ACE5LB_02710 [Acidiferrobacterales bacterium]